MNSSSRRLPLVNRCRCLAPCGHGCCLLATVEHTLHICECEECYCHRRQRYIGGKSLRATAHELSRRRAL